MNPWVLSFKDSFNDSMILESIKEIQATQELALQNILLRKQEQLDQLKIKYSTQDKVSRASGPIAIFVIVLMFAAFLAADLARLYNFTIKHHKLTNKIHPNLPRSHRNSTITQKNEMQFQDVIETNQLNSFDLFVKLNRIRAHSINQAPN